MQEQSRYAVGIDIGTKSVRCVIGHIDVATGAPKIIGVGQAPNSGMRKGVITHLNGPATAIDAALDTAERMSGHRVHTAVLGVNGAHLISTKADGMIAVDAASGEVTEDDVARLESVATVGKVPANREILEVVPYEYRLDGQDGIKNPIGMAGTRLELRANVVSGMAPHLANVHKLAEMSNIEVVRAMPTALASAHAVLSEAQMENGVVVIDIGAATTGVSVFEEGDLQHLAVIPMGSQNVTNDLAIGLKIDLEIAEQVKLQHAELNGETKGIVNVKHGKQAQAFHRAEVAEIIEARYEEIFELIAKELKKAGGISKMPSGAVLVGGGAKVKGLADFAKEQIGLAVKIGMPQEYAGMTDEIKNPEYAAAIGLMLATAHSGSQTNDNTVKKNGNITQKAGGMLSRLLAKFK